MCGIFGSIATGGVVDNTLSALKLLQYRGYDSVGVALKQQGRILIVKQAGRVEALEPRLQGISSNMVIAHTRWATHGGVTDNNAHPFVSFDGNIALVHNGIIENYKTLREWIGRQGITLTSDTDSEAIAHLLALQLDKCGNILQAICHLTASLVGSFALAILCKNDNNIYLVRQDSPLCVALTDDASFVCSDVATLSRYASQAIVLPDKCIAVLSANALDAYDYQLNQVDVLASEITMQLTDIATDGSYMYSEIISIPEATKRSLDNYKGIAMSASQIRKIKRIYFVGCGTAYNSGVIVASYLRSLLNIDIHCVISSEFVYGNYIVDGNTLLFFISQSGETADTLKACHKANSLEGITYGVVNVDNSSLTRVSRYVSMIHAGSEIAVASTKAYNCSVTTLMLIALDIVLYKGALTQSTYAKHIEQLHALPSCIEEVLATRSQIQSIVADNLDVSAVFFVGRDCDYATAMESSLKLKEISYIHSESYPSGELKHGTLALMDEDVLVVSICTNGALLDKCNNTIMEVGSRGAKVILLSQYNSSSAHYHICLPIAPSICYGCLTVVPMQLFAYYYALALGRDIDKPKNLAKSVTVE